MPIIEIVKWSASDAYVADHSVLKPTLDFIVKQKGNLGYDPIFFASQFQRVIDNLPSALTYNLFFGLQL